MQFTVTLEFIHILEPGTYQTLKLAQYIIGIKKKNKAANKCSLLQ